jgi:hypothetical protein
MTFRTSVSLQAGKRTAPAPASVVQFILFALCGQDVIMSEVDSKASQAHADMKAAESGACAGG